MTVDPMQGESALSDDNRISGFDQIYELNADLPESTITLYLPPEYDISLAPVRAIKNRDWWQEDQKTRDLARFCLPLAMGSGMGWYILSPATFTVSWDGDETHDAQLEITETCSHAIVDTHSARGSFTVQAQFIPRTKKPGDFVYVRGIANDYRKPYYFLDALLESWWSPANFGLVGMLNQPCRFTIKKGEPIAQMFAIHIDQTNYDIALRRGYPTQWKEWDDRRSAFPKKTLDYLRGQWPDGRPVCPHFKSFSGTMNNEVVAEENVSMWELVRSAGLALKSGTYEAAVLLMERALELSDKENSFSLSFLNLLLQLGRYCLDKSDLEGALAYYTKAISLSRRLQEVDHSRLVDLFNDTAFVERALKKTEECQEHYKIAIEIAEGTNTNEVGKAEAMLNLGLVYYDQLKYDEAEPLLKKASDLRQEIFGEDHPNTFFAMNALALLYMHQGKYDVAEKLFNIVLTKRAAKFGPDSLDVARNLNEIGFLHNATKQFEKAQQSFEKALAIFEKELPKDSDPVQTTADNLAFALDHLNRKEEAQSLRKRIMQNEN
jgi:tetratricopeptide (TPR) repeat protein